MKKITFIIPMFNGAKTIERLLTSLSRQGLDCDEMEAIIIDDASTDGSANLVERLKSTYPFLNLYKGKNLGPGGGRNIGIQLAKGEYIWFVDADDYLGDGAAGVLIRFMSELKLDILEFDFFFDFENLNSPKANFFKENVLPANVLSGLEYIAKYGYRKTVTTAIIRTSFIQGEGLMFTKQRGHEDAIYMPRLMARVRRASYYPSPAYAYVRTQGTLSNPMTEERLVKYLDDSLFAMDELRELESDFKRMHASAKVIFNINVHRETLAFFVLLKMRFRNISFLELIRLHRLFRNKSHLPLRFFGTNEYQSARYKVLKFIINNQILYALLIKAYQMLCK